MSAARKKRKDYAFWCCVVVEKPDDILGCPKAGAVRLRVLTCAVLMGQARIYWDTEHYSKVQAILQQSTDFCSEHEAWKLNSAHTFFMQGGMVDSDLPACVSAFFAPCPATGSLA